MGGPGPGASAGTGAGAGSSDAWYFTREQLAASASRRCGLDADKELSYRQQAANLIQDMGQRLQVSQLCINTAIVYMHRFYAFHSFTHFHRNSIAAAALFLAAKVEEQPRKLEYVIKVAHVCLHRGESAAGLDPRSEHYLEQAQDLVFNENVLLQTLGFDVAIDHPHTHVVRTCHLVKAPKDLAQTSYFMASNSLHLTTMCLQYKPTVVACFCIHLASKWSNWAIPTSNEGRHWFSYVDRSVTTELLEKLTSEFLHIFDKCPSRLRKKIKEVGGSPHGGSAQAAGSAQQAAAVSSPFDHKKAQMTEDMEKSFDREYEREKRRAAAATGGYVAAAAAVPAQPAPQKIDFREYREKREREERERRQALHPQPRPAPATAPPAPRVAPPPHPHHHKPANHHKPHPWPAGQHKPPHHKPAHDARHHRPSAPPQAPGQAAPAPAPEQARPEHPRMEQPRAEHPRVEQPRVEHPRVEQPRAEHPRVEQPPQRTRPPSLFSPENATAPSAAAAAPRRPPAQLPQQRRPQPTQQVPQPPPSQAAPPPLVPTPAIERPEMSVEPVPQRKRPDSMAAVVREMQPPALVSPLTSPTAPSPQQRSRHRTGSSSEPELVPVVKKLDETPGYENVIRDSQRGNAIRTRTERPPEARRTSPPRPVNGIETDPAMVSNLLKESLVRPVTVTPPVERPVQKPPSIGRVAPQVPAEPVKVPVPEEFVNALSSPAPVDPNAPSEQRHRSEKKKKKEKHKHKDREKPRDERKKHKKDKEREKKRESEAAPAVEPSAPVETKIVPTATMTTGLKIKIPKDRIAAPIPTPPSAPHAPPPQWQPPPQPRVSELKIKIPKEVLTSRKRPGFPEPPGPPPKMYRHNGVPPHKVEPTGGHNGQAPK